MWGDVLSNRHIIVPCRNESGNIPCIVSDFLTNFQQGDNLWLVEGGSQDNTAEICLGFASEENSIHFLSQIGRGKFGGVKTVTNHLIDVGESGLIAIWDADNSIKFLDVSKALLLAKSSECFVFTERIGATIERGAMPLINKLGNRVIALLASIVFKVKIKDALSGTKVFDLSLFRGLEGNRVLEFLSKDTYGDLSYFLLAKLKGTPMLALHVDYYARKYGVSSLNRISNGVELLMSLKFARRILIETRREKCSKNF